MDRNSLVRVRVALLELGEDLGQLVLHGSNSGHNLCDLAFNLDLVLCYFYPNLVALQQGKVHNLLRESLVIIEALLTDPLDW